MSYVFNMTLGLGLAHFSRSHKTKTKTVCFVEPIQLQVSGYVQFGGRLKDLLAARRNDSQCVVNTLASVAANSAIVKFAHSVKHRCIQIQSDCAALATFRLFGARFEIELRHKLKTKRKTFLVWL